MPFNLSMSKEGGVKMSGDVDQDKIDISEGDMKIKKQREKRMKDGQPVVVEVQLVTKVVDGEKVTERKERIIPPEELAREEKAKKKKNKKKMKAKLKKEKRKSVSGTLSVGDTEISTDILDEINISGSDESVRGPDGQLLGTARRNQPIKVTGDAPDLNVAGREVVHAVRSGSTGPKATPTEKPAPGQKSEVTAEPQQEVEETTIDYSKLERWAEQFISQHMSTIRWTKPTEQEKKIHDHGQDRMIIIYHPESRQVTITLNGKEVLNHPQPFEGK